MTWEIAYHKEVKGEIKSAYRRYEKEKEGLGEEFAECVHGQIAYLEMNPKIHAKVFKDVRKAVVKRFPFCIYYTIEGDRVFILSVFHTRQNPAKWQARVE
jgi:plasmid stabilization system protein ParE